MTNDSYIHIDEQRVNRRQFIPWGVRFELDSNNLIEINLARENNTKIQLSKNTLTNLRYYLFCASQVHQRLLEHKLITASTELVFTTNYLKQRESISVIRSVINLEGKITQTIQYDLWQNSAQFNKLLNIHHWLIVQIMTQLPLKSQNYLEPLSWGLSLIIAAIAGLLIFYLFSANILFKIILIVLSLLIIKTTIKYLLKFKIKQWIIERLLFGFLGQGARKRNLALQIINILR
jgi:VIT1/CCC1 family predicted Fe2+/Mn2+ transporter